MPLLIVVCPCDASAKLFLALPLLIIANHFDSMLCLCFTLPFRSRLCHCQRFLASPLRIRTLSCHLRNLSMPRPCRSMLLQALPCPCYLYVPLHFHAVAMLSISAPAIHSSSTQCPRYSLPCNAIAVPGFSVQCLCFHTLCVALPPAIFTLYRLRSSNLFGTKPLQFHAILCLCFAKRSHRPV